MTVQRLELVPKDVRHTLCVSAQAQSGLVASAIMAHKSMYPIMFVGLHIAAVWPLLQRPH